LESTGEKKGHPQNEDEDEEDHPMMTEAEIGNPFKQPLSHDFS
jgi:hypothetical protein